jgi:hypothetical protein
MDLLERARMLAACPLFESLAPAVVVRLAERARATELARGERRTTDDTVWVVASGSLAVMVRPEGGTADITASIAKKRGAGATAGNALGMIRVVRPTTPAVELIAEQASVVLALTVDDVRDVLEEDPAGLTALADRLAGLLLGDS